MSSPTTGPVQLKTEQKLPKHVSLRWDYDSCPIESTSYKIYRLKGAERSGKAIQCDGELIATVADTSYIDTFNFDDYGVYSYTVVAFQGLNESDPTSGRVILI